MEKKNELKYKSWHEHLNSTKERTNYSIRRFDLLVISISSGTLYVVFQTLKEFKTNKIDIENISLLLLSSGLLSVISIILNLISQYTGYWSNNFEEKYINLKLKKIEGKKINKSQQSIYNKKINRLNFVTELFNVISLIAMILAILLLSVFYSSLF